MRAASSPAYVDAFDADEKLRWEDRNPYFFAHFWGFAPDAAPHLDVARFHLIARYAQMRDAMMAGHATLTEERDVHCELDVNAERS